MQHKYIPQSEQITSQWSGGTTTQLYIYPEDANYQKRDFLFRISSAKVETETSVFTKLEGIQRHLMILDGELSVEHKGHHRAHLKPFEIDSFMGDWETHASGRVTDFNLMLSSGAKGTVTHVELLPGERTNLEIQESDFVALYAWKGSVSLEEFDQQLNLGDFFIIQSNGIGQVQKIEAKGENTVIVICRINEL